MLFKIASIGVFFVMNVCCSNCVTANEEENDITIHRNSSGTPMTATMPRNNVLIKMDVSSLETKRTVALDGDMIKTFSTCLCGLDNKACTIKDGTIDMEKFDENEWTRNYFGNEYHCELSLRTAQLVSCTRMNTKATFSGCDTKEHYMCSAVLLASCPLFPSQSLTIYWTNQQTVVFTTWSQEVESVFTRVSEEKDPEKEQKRNESSIMTVVAWVFIAICVILTIVVIVLTNLAIIGRSRLQQLSIHTNMAIDNDNDKKESNGPKLNVCHASTCTDDRKPLEHEKAFRLCERKDFLLKDDLQPKPGSSEALKQKVLMNKEDIQSSCMLETINETVCGLNMTYLGVKDRRGEITACKSHSDRTAYA